MNKFPIRFGGLILANYETPAEWISLNKKHGYSAAYCPVNYQASDDFIKEYANVAQKANIIIAEVGAWSNPISPDDMERKKAFDICVQQLELAEKIGASCCVNISGSRSKTNWDGPDPENLTEQTFELIVEITRKIIDEVQPTRTYFTLETMPWIYPHSAESYSSLLKAINRKQFAVHFDPVNLINSPEKYYNNSQVIDDFISRFGPYIKSCHAKDIILRPDLTFHLDEIRPGLGSLNYSIFLKQLSKLPDVPIMLEHLKSQNEYTLAANYIRSVAKKNGLSLLKV